MREWAVRSWTGGWRPGWTMSRHEPAIAVIVPCHNEEQTIGRVVENAQAALPNAGVYVFDNASTDRTAERARAAGARVVSTSPKGKGVVVNRMFADVDADVYLLVDGDSTYDLGVASKLVRKLLDERLDMVVGCRVDEGHETAYRYGHRFGNRMLTAAIRGMFGGTFTDVLSGYRAFSRRYVKTFPSHSKGFEIEAEMTVHALTIGMPCGEIDTRYGARPADSVSKLSTYTDGTRILITIMRLYVSEHPFSFYGAVGVLLGGVSVLLALPLLTYYLETGLVPRLPTAVLSLGLMLSGQLAWVCGTILDGVTRGRKELRRMAYLRIPGPDSLVP